MPRGQINRKNLVTESGAASPGLYPHVHVPYDRFSDYRDFLRDNELNFELYFGTKNFDSISTDDIADLKHSLKYSPDISIHAPFMDLSPGAVDLKVRELTVKRFSSVLDFAEILNPRVIVFHSGFDRWKYDKRDNSWLEASLETWLKINGRAASLGVQVAIENIFEDEPENLRILASEMDSENFGICFDTGHFNLFSKLTLKEWLAIVKPYIKELHLHDNNRYADEHLALGEGDFDFQTLFSELKGIDCVYTLEAHSIENINISLTRIKQYL
ncbi:MAG: sugar phosphate isomerase/epimerase [Nitrospira sp.]|nr:sugar phosphate isomerase/epimerase [bacterium]MBL7049123.1 sugar phosphate isomerase/epimerase [Nitrospira sp.]